MNNFFRISKLPILVVLTLFFLTSCGGWDPADSRDVPTGGIDRAKKNIKEGRGISLKGLTGNRSTTFEFGTSNPMWRATFDVIDFMPLITVDYAGGMIITDWYTDKRAPSESLKFTIRFLSNDIRADSIKIIIHRRVCQQKTDCVIKKISSKLEHEVRTAILQRAALLDEGKIDKKVEDKKRKKGFFGFGRSSSREELENQDKLNKRHSGTKKN